MTKFPKILAATAVGLMLMAPMAQAEDDAVPPEMLAKVTAEMTAQGYEVRKVQMEDGMIEVYAVKDGKTYELYLDEALKVVKSKED